MRKELDLNSAHREYVVCVLSLLDVAYESLTKGTTFEPCDLHQIVEDPQFLDDSPALVWLRVIFDKRKKLTADAVFHFFEKHCIEMVLDFMYRQNRDGQTAYDLAVEHNREQCIQLLNPATVREKVYDPLRRIVEKCLRGEKRDIIEHRPDTPLTSLILQRLPISLLSEEHLEVVKVVVAAPTVGVGLPFYCISRSNSLPQALLQIAALPVTVPAAAVVSIPVGLFMLAIKAVMRKAL